jgi:hypothetical protein
VDDDQSLLNEPLPPFDDAFPLLQLSFPLQLTSPPPPHPPLHKLLAHGLQRALPPPLQQMEKEGTEGEDCQPIQSTAMESVQTGNQVGATDLDAVGQAGEAVVQGMTCAEAKSTLGLQSLEGE